MDRQRLKGYNTKWRDGQELIGCALYVDILQSPSFLSLTLQNDGLDIVQGIQHILKSHQSLACFTESTLVAYSKACQ